MAIRNFVFDLGNVAVLYDPPAMLRDFHLTEEETALFVRTVFLGPAWRRYDGGEGDKKTLLAPVAKTLPPKLREICLGFACSPDLERDFMPPTPGFEALANALADRGASLYLLSNAGFDIRRLTDTLPALRRFSGIYISSEHRLLKPDPAIYRSFFETFALSPETCVFTDDAPANCAAAEALGMRAVRFNALTDPMEALRERLFSFFDERN